MNGRPLDGYDGRPSSRLGNLRLGISVEITL